MNNTSQRMGFIKKIEDTSSNGYDGAKLLIADAEFPKGKVVHAEDGNAGELKRMNIDRGMFIMTSCYEKAIDSNQHGKSYITIMSNFTIIPSVKHDTEILFPDFNEINMKRKSRFESKGSAPSGDQADKPMIGEPGKKDPIIEDDLPF